MTADIAERPKATSLVVRFADRFGLEANRMVATLKATAFRTSQAITDEQLAQLLIVAEQYNLNPFTKELYAYVDDKRGGAVVPVVGIDGWLRIINERPEFDGMDIVEADDGSTCTVTIYRKDRTHPTVITERLIYNKRNTAAWTGNPPRMLRHRATMQCGRYAFGFAGIHDDDDAHRIIDGGDVERVEPPSASAQRVRAVLAGAGSSEGGVIQSVATPVDRPAPADIIDMEEPPLDIGRSFGEYCADLLHAESQEDAELILAEAKDVLPLDKHQELTAAYRGKWTNKE